MHRYFYVSMHAGYGDKCPLHEQYCYNGLSLSTISEITEYYYAHSHYMQHSPDSQQFLEEDMDLLQLVTPTMTSEKEIWQKEEEERRWKEEEERRQKEEEERRQKEEEERRQKEEEERRQKEEEERRQKEEEETRQKEEDERRFKAEVERRRKQEEERMRKEEEERRRKEEEKAFRNLAKHVKKCSEEAGIVTSHRNYGSRRMHQSADEFEAIFTTAAYILFGTVGAAGVLTLATGGLAAALLGVGVGGGVAALIYYITKEISRNNRLMETDAWIMSDRENFKKLLTASTVLERALNELERLNIYTYQANIYLREHCGFSEESDISIDYLKELQHSLTRTLDIVRKKGLASGNQEAIKRATEEVEKRIKEFLEGDQHATGWWDATHYTDTQGIGRVGGEVFWSSRKRPPVGDLLRTLGEAITNDDEMGPIKKMGKLYDSC